MLCNRNADPDSDLSFDADTDADPTFRLDVDPDPSSQIKAQKVLNYAQIPYILACHLQIDVDPYRAYHFDVDPDADAGYQNEADPQHCFRFFTVSSMVRRSRRGCDPRP